MFRLVLSALLVASWATPATAFVPRHVSAPTEASSLSLAGVNNKDDAEETSRAKKSSMDKLRPWSRKKYATGLELEQLRGEINNFRETLQWSEAINDKDRVKDLAEAIEKAEARDPDICYGRALEEMAALQKKGGSPSRIEKLAQEAAQARTFLAQFQLEGLWVGK